MDIANLGNGLSVSIYSVSAEYTFNRKLGHTDNLAMDEVVFNR
jgi:hypothetical protein